MYTVSSIVHAADTEIHVHHVRPGNKMSLTRGLKQKKTIKLSAAKSGHDR